MKERSVAIATTVLYPNFTGEGNGGDNIRGRLALKSLESAARMGYQVVAVDDGCSGQFRQNLERRNVHILEGGLGMSSGRRQALRAASELEDVKVLAWIEPEKSDFFATGLGVASAPLLKDEADLVIPSRSPESFDNYPSYQIKTEQRGNGEVNSFLREHSLLKPEDQDLDYWFGPRLLQNKPELVELFMERYLYCDPESLVDRWVLMIPVIAALERGFRVKSVPVNYTHPVEQRTAEEGDENFNRKRDEQYRHFVSAAREYVYLRENDPRCKIKKVEDL